MALLLLGLLSLTGLASLAEGSEVGPGSSSSSSSSSSSHTTEIHPRFNMPQSYLFCAAQLSSNPDDFPPGTDLAWYKGDLAKYCLTPPTSLGNAAPFGPGGLCLPYLPTLKFNQAQVPPNVMDLWMAHRTCAASLPCPRCECMWDQEKYEAERKAYEARVRWQQFQQDLGLTWNPAGAGARGQGRSSRPETLSQTEAMDTEMHRVCSVEQPGNEHSANPAANAAAEGTGTCSNHANPTGQAGQAGFVNMGTVAVGPTLPAAQAGQGQSQGQCPVNAIPCVTNGACHRAEMAASSSSSSATAPSLRRSCRCRREIDPATGRARQTVDPSTGRRTRPIGTCGGVPTGRGRKRRKGGGNGRRRDLSPSQVGGGGLRSWDLECPCTDREDEDAPWAMECCDLAMHEL